jgi:rRNA-processing protein EBP2
MKGDIDSMQVDDGHGLLCRLPDAARRSERQSPFGQFPFSVFSLRPSPLLTPSPSSIFGTMGPRNVTHSPDTIKPEQKKLASFVKLPTPDDSSSNESDEDSGVDEQGLQNLVKALGEDGLDEFDLAQLRMLNGSPIDEEEESGEDDDADATTESEDVDQPDVEKEEEGIALDDEDVDSVDEDAVPRRKVEVDNKARPFHSLPCPANSS